LGGQRLLGSLLEDVVGSLQARFLGMSGLDDRVFAVSVEVALSRRSEGVRVGDDLETAVHLVGVGGPAQFVEAVDPEPASANLTDRGLGVGIAPNKEFMTLGFPPKQGELEYIRSCSEGERPASAVVSTLHLSRWVCRFCQEFQYRETPSVDLMWEFASSKMGVGMAWCAETYTWVRRRSVPGGSSVGLYLFNSLTWSAI